MESADSIEINFSFSNFQNVVDLPTQSLNWNSQHEISNFRKNDLWKTTCFECFFSDDQGRTYTEVNVSPMNGWNIYQFEGYRTPLPPNESLKWTLSKMNYSNTGLVFEVKRLEKKASISKSEFLFSLTAVINCGQDHNQYWATHHEAEQPDFHQIKSFNIKRTWK